jgi:tetratricopeptide (TPR) repeat protein
VQDLLTVRVHIINLMFSTQNFRFQLVLVAGAIALLCPWIGCNAFAGGTEEQVCDVSADYALGIEDYSETIRLHAEVVRKDPENALAHYHLGFAQGVIGDRTAEVTEYKRAEALGLRIWDLFLNLGLAQIENGDLNAATDSLQRAVLLGGEHWESHFDLAAVEERRGMLADAEHEALVSLGLNPGQPDARNLLGVIYAQEGKTVRASLIWRELMHDVPDYEPARTNLALLDSQSEVVLARRRPLPSPPQRPPSKPSTMRAEDTCRHPKYS